MNDDIYNIINDSITYIRNYYLDYQDYIESFEFPRIDYLFLIKNISLLYKALNISKEILDKWYKDKDEKYLFYSIICIPEKIMFSKDIYKNIVKINRLFNHTNNSIKFVLEKNKEDEKTNSNKFNE